MKKKITSESGLTMIELLLATAIMLLLALMLNTGLGMAIHTYETIVAKSEVDVLLSTAVDALANELRYARDVESSGDGTGDFTYTSDSYGEGASFRCDESTDFRIKVNNFQMLPTGAYGSSLAYKSYEIHGVEDSDIIIPNISDDDSGITFTINLEVTTKDGSISSRTPDGGVVVRCLNPPADELETPEEFPP